MADLASILGADRLTDHDGTPVLTPRDEAEVAALLAAATRDGLSLRVRGGGTKRDWQAAPERCDAILSTAALTGIVDHQPGDMTLVARAGTPLAAVQSAIAADDRHRQRLMLDSLGGDAATLGGILSTRAAGPRRHRYGTPRDIVIGARYVTGDGLAAKTGGTVVKNVAGYDVAKLLIGAHGSLAVLTEVAVKLHPVPDVERTLVLRTTDAGEAARFVAALRTAPVTPIVVDVRWPEGLVAVRIASTAAGADAQVALLHELAALDELDATAGDALLEEHLAFPFSGTGAVLGVGVRPTDLAPLLAAVTAAGGAFTGRAALVAGDVVLPDADPDRITRLVSAIRALDGNVTARRTAEAHDLAAPVPTPGVALLDAAMRSRLDPAGALA
ncbi:MAG: FAD-binding oxidoreductase [Gaiellales bacterium]